MLDSSLLKSCLCGSKGSSVCTVTLYRDMSCYLADKRTCVGAQLFLGPFFSRTFAPYIDSSVVGKGGQ